MLKVKCVCGGGGGGGSDMSFLLNFNVIGCINENFLINFHDREFMIRLTNYNKW